MSVLPPFTVLHQQNLPLCLPNVWDAASAMLAQQAGAAALATSSAALAWSLGYADGETLPVDELLAAVQRLLRIARVPVSIDLERGYSDEPGQVAALVGQLATLGVAGVNLEDGTQPAALLADKIHACRQALAGQPLFINARTDVYLAGLASGQAAIDSCRARSRLYQAAGADCLFVPGLTDLSVAAAISAPAPAGQQSSVHQHAGLPLNLMGWPTGASAADIRAAGVCRISYGPALFIDAYQQFYQAAHLITTSAAPSATPPATPSATPQPAPLLSYAQLNDWLLNGCKTQ